MFEFLDSMSRTAKQGRGLAHSFGNSSKTFVDTVRDIPHSLSHRN
jgi:hypothetical protein